jgi:hypothetical protein
VWVFSNLEPEKAPEIYRSRMKMEPSFRDLKGLPGPENGMSKKLENLEKWIAFMLLAYAVGLRIGETIRDEVYRGEKRQAYSGLFILLQRRLRLRLRPFLRLIRLAPDRFRTIVQGPFLYLLPEGQPNPIGRRRFSDRRRCRQGSGSFPRAGAPSTVPDARCAPGADGGAGDGGPAPPDPPPERGPKCDRDCPPP